MAIKNLGGRPPLSSSPEFLTGLKRVLPHVYVGDISQRQAALELGISARSLKRYIEQHEQQEIGHA